MLDIKNFLRKYANLTPPDAAVRKAVIESVRTFAGVDLEEKQIRVIRSVVYVDTDSAVRNKLFLIKGKLLARVGEKLGSMRVVTDIK